LLTNIEKLLEIGRETEKNKTNGQRDLFGGFTAVKTTNINYNNYTLLAAREASRSEKLMWEKELLGLFCYF